MRVPVTAPAILFALGLAALIGAGLFGLASWRERELRAARAALLSGGLLALPLFLALLLPSRLQWAVAGIVGVTVVAVFVLFLLPVGRVERGNDQPATRVDERDIVFARARLRPGSPDYEAYYTMRPANLAADEKTRRLPGLLSPRASGYHALAFAATAASFDLTEALREAVDGPVAAKALTVAPSEITSFLKHLSRFYGAQSVGIAQIRPYHVYTHVGRGSGAYGAAVALDHPFGIAFTVEMAPEMLDTAPGAPTMMESAHQYVEAARVALQLASFIRRLGYRARAHINGNYRVIAPVVAWDAGLGEIGRMGLLMTPELGPRVRLGVVTTDLPLVPDGRSPDDSVLDFCGVCLKCAHSCPVRAIPSGDRQEFNGTLRWRIDADLCYRYWNAIGTDCGRCMAVCPYSHPNSPIHRAVRGLVRRSGAARRAAVWLDDLFYGPVPAPKPFPHWLDIGPTEANRNTRRR